MDFSIFSTNCSRTDTIYRFSVQYSQGFILFNELFEPISMILVDPDNLAKVLKTKNADEFIDTLAGLLP